MLTNPFAFLVAVICDQGIKAERDWALPYELRRRLGYLDPERIVADPERVTAAIADPPALHRYVSRVPRWIVSASERVLKDYGGDAEAIWRGAPSAFALQTRFDEFLGIGRKKAVMAVELLERDLHV